MTNDVELVFRLATAAVPFEVFPVKCFRAETAAAVTPAVMQARHKAPRGGGPRSQAQNSPHARSNPPEDYPFVQIIPPMYLYVRLRRKSG
jgi:hypothetical protein